MSGHQDAGISKLKGNINHAVCRWCFDHLSLPELCQEAIKLGIKAIDLAGPEDWPVLQQYGLYSSMCNGAEISLTEGWNNTDHHPVLIENYSKMIPLVAGAGYKNLICFSGNRNGLSDEMGLENCRKGLVEIMELAQRYDVMIVMELLNSRVDHPDYQCDKSTWGIELVQRIGSPNFKLLFDIYHMQIDEGDIIRTIRQHHRHFAHYHTAGVPGRNEPDDDQELNYPAIMRTIRDTGFIGYVAHEFIPKRTDKLAALQYTVSVCDV